MKNFLIKLLYIIPLLLFMACPPDATQLGCMDSAACNYDPAVTEDDGSCQIPLDNLIEVTYLEDYVSGLVGEDVIAHVNVRNASCNTITDLVVRKFFNNSDASAYFCFNDICFPSATIVAPNPMVLDSFEEDDYFKSYLNASVPGTYNITYRFFLDNDPSQMNEVTITYEIN
tara:strand:+ start:145 stop:660 length:516 start_codon:yes stop_codon:yes gene_type:complete